MKVLSLFKRMLKFIVNGAFSHFQIVGVMMAAFASGIIMLSLDFLFLHIMKALNSGSLSGVEATISILSYATILSTVVAILLRTIVDFFCRNKEKESREKVYDLISTFQSYCSLAMGFMGAATQFSNDKFINSAEGKFAYLLVFGMLICIQNLVFSIYFKTVAKFDNDKNTKEILNFIRYKMFSFELKREIKKTTKVISYNELLGRRLFKSLISDLISADTMEKIKLNSSKEEAFMDILYSSKMTKCTDAIKKDKTPSTKIIKETLPLVEEICNIL